MLVLFGVGIFQFKKNIFSYLNKKEVNLFKCVASFVEH
jgi:hypothetical protein